MSDMNYTIYAIIGLLAYSAVAPLVKFSTKKIPPQIAVIVTNFILVVTAVTWAKFRGYDILEHLTLSKHNLYLYLAGLVLGVGIISYYMALSLGPVSVVVPIFGLYIAVSSVAGGLVMGESFSATKIAGLCLAIVSIFLVTR